MAGGGVREALLDEAAVDHVHDALDGHLVRVRVRVRVWVTVRVS